MPSLAEKIRFAEERITAPDGEPFSLKGRDWVVDEFWRPVDSWKLWPVDKSRLCSDCAALANTITEDYRAGDETRTEKHARTGCRGLQCEPILIVALNLKRQSGKTFNVAAWAMARAFKDKGESIALLAGSQDQVARLYAKNYKRPIENNKTLSRLAKCLGTKIVVEKTGSDIEILPTAMSSVGDTRTAVIIDECRVVPPDIAVALIPTLFARGGWQCPTQIKTHARSHSGVEDPEAPRRCTVCDAETQPWYGKALLLSSAGELDDSESDWFFEFIGYYSKNPHPNVHVFTSEKTLNPKVSQKLVGVTEDVFGHLESTKLYASIETGNTPGRKGDEVLTKAEVKLCADGDLEKLDECALPCVAFFDTALTREKVSLVTLAEEPGSSRPWEKVFTPRIDWWDPGAMTNHIVGDAEEKEITAHLLRVLPLYTGLRVLHIDVRTGADSGETWGRRVAQSLRKAGLTVQLWEKNTPHESMAGWAELIKRVRTRTIRYFDMPEIHAEFGGIVPRKRRDGSIEIVDKNRDKMHKDIIESLALCCYLAATEGSKSHISMAARAGRTSTKVRVGSPRSRIFGRLGDNAW